MNSELEKLIEKYRITVNGLADLESGYEKVIKERGFVTLNGLLVESNEPAGEGTENTVNTENTPVADETATTVESDTSHSEPTPVVPAPSEIPGTGLADASEISAENTPVAPTVPAAPTPSEPATEQPGVTPVVEGPVSGDTNLGNESAAAHNPSGEVAGGERAARTEEDSASTDEHNPSASAAVPSGEEETSEEEDPASTEDSTTGGKPKKKKK